MLGAIIGDIAGSRFEWKEWKSKEFVFLADSMLYVAKPYLNRGWWGANFYQWLTRSQTPYNSWGNGAAMRVGSVGWIADSEEEVKYFSKLVTEISHNHPEGIKGAEVTAMAIYLARTGADMPTIRERMIEYYPQIAKMTVDNIRPGYCIDDQGSFISCQGSVPEAIVCFLESTSLEDAIRNVISLGGDSDTQAAITGSMAEAFWGIPYELEEKTMEYLTDDLRSICYAFETDILSQCALSKSAENTWGERYFYATG